MIGIPIGWTHQSLFLTNVFLYYYQRKRLRQAKKQDLANPADNYMFKINNENTRTRCEICSKLTIKKPERRPLNIFTPCSSVSIVNLKQLNTG